MKQGRYKTVVQSSGLSEVIIAKEPTRDCSDFPCDVVEQVKEIIKNNRANPGFNINHAAELLSVGPRTLQRRLKDLATTFKTLQNIDRVQYLSEAQSKGNIMDTLIKIAR